MRACSSSSTTLSTGPGTCPSSSSCSPAPARRQSTRVSAWAGTVRRSRSTRSTTPRWTAWSRHLSPACPPGPGRDHRPGRGHRPVRGRDGPLAHRPRDRVRRDGGYRLVGGLGELKVPDCLHALLAARLDALAPRGALAGRRRQRARHELSQRRPRRGLGQRMSAVRAGPQSSWCAETCSRSSPTRSPRNGAPTASARRCCARSPTRRCPRRTASPATSPWLATCGPSSPTMARRSPTPSPATTSMLSPPAPTTPTPTRSGPRRSRRWCAPASGPSGPVPPGVRQPAMRRQPSWPPPVLRRARTASAKCGPQRCESGPPWQM